MISRKRIRVQKGSSHFLAAFYCSFLLNPNRKTAQADYISSRQAPEPFRGKRKRRGNRSSGTFLRAHAAKNFCAHPLTNCQFVFFDLLAIGEKSSPFGEYLRFVIVRKNEKVKSK
jgi:hypothetical protein